MTPEELVVWLLEKTYVNPYDVPTLLKELKKEYRKRGLK